MQKLIYLNDIQKAEFSEFIRLRRAKIISSPADTLQAVLKNYQIKNIKIDNISSHILELRRLTFEHFLAQESDFNAAILGEISAKFKLPKEILAQISQKFFTQKTHDFAEFNAAFSQYFGEYAGAISPYIYELCLSNTNSRRSRGGKTFEAIIYFLYKHFGFSFDSQISIGKKAFSERGLGKVVDSILPSVAAFSQMRNKTIVGSMKTTLRERWQEVVEEIGRSNLPNIYLLTCDDEIAPSKIRQMSEHNIVLVVYMTVKERLADFASVMSFEEYFGAEIPAVMEWWNAKNR